MTKIFKNPTIIGLTIIGVLSIIAYAQLRNREIKLYKCSTYTVGLINRVYTNRGIIYATYQYNLNGKTVKATKSVSNSDTNESWIVDMNKLSKRRLLVRVYCNDINVHRIIWDVGVPDTLRDIPAQGWNYPPFKSSN